MRTIDDYLDAILARNPDIKSDRGISRRLGIAGSNASLWRTRRTWPDDTTMERIAELAGVDPAEALMELNAWRAKSDRVREIYKRVLLQVARALPAVLLGLTTWLLLDGHTHVVVAGITLNYTLCDILMLALLLNVTAFQWFCHAPSRPER